MEDRRQDLEENITTKVRLHLNATRVFTLKAAAQFSVVLTMNGSLRYQNVLKVQRVFFFLVGFGFFFWGGRGGGNISLN